MAESTHELLVRTLREIDGMAPAKEPEYQVWSDTEEAETWGECHGLWEAAQVARKALTALGYPTGGTP